MPHHMAQAHPGVSHDYARCTEEEETKVLQAFDNFRAPLPTKVKRAAPPALPIVLSALLSAPNRGSSSSGNSSSSSSTTNASSSTSASSSSSAPSGTSDYVPSESMSDGLAACRVTRSQAARPNKRPPSPPPPRVPARGHTTSGRTIPMLEAPPLPSLLYIYIYIYVCGL